jgi:hypothetical protein
MNLSVLPFLIILMLCCHELFEEVKAFPTAFDFTQNDLEVGKLKENLKEIIIPKLLCFTYSGLHNLWRNTGTEPTTHVLLYIHLHKLVLISHLNLELSL